MKNHQWLAFTAGIFGIYLLIHAGVAGRAVYMAQEVLKLPASSNDPYIPELRENYGTLVTVCLLFTTFGSLSVASSIGFIRKSNWGRSLWIFNSAGLVLCVLYAMIMRDVVWTAYIFELAVVGVSWWYLFAPAKRNHDVSADRVDC